MARLPIQNPQSASGSNKQIFDVLQKKLGMVPNMARVMGNSPAVLQGYVQLSGALASGRLTARVREQIALLIAEENGCAYCLSAHTAGGKVIGLDQSQIDGARHGESDDPSTRAALAFARAVIDTRGGVSDADVEVVRGAGFSDAEIAEIVGAVALSVFTNYFNRAFAVDVDFPRVDAHTHAAAR